MSTNKLKTTVVIFIVLFSFSSYAQEKSENIDQITLELFQKKEYKKLITISENAIKNETDYFYLRFRLGVAYYETGNYRLAAYHLEKAMAFNADDPTELEYLYYSYYFSGRFSDASLLTLKMADELIVKTGYKTRLLSSVYFEGGVSLSNNISKNAGIDIDGENNIYGENDMNNNILYGHIGLKHEILPFLSIYHGFSHIEIEKQKIIKTQFNNLLIDTIYNYTLTQNEYYINSDIQLKHGLKLTPAFHFMNVTAKGIKFDTTQFPPFSEDNLNIKNYVISLAIAKEYKNFTIGLSGTYSNLNSAKQIQGGISITYYPFGNLNLYTNTDFVYFYQKKSAGQGGNKDSRIIFDQMVGLKVFPRLWTEASFTLGNLANYNEKNAFIVYNIADKINFKTGISLIYTLTSKLELSIRYQYLKRESEYISYESLSPVSIKNNTINYQNNTIIGGIKWKL